MAFNHFSLIKHICSVPEYILITTICIYFVMPDTKHCKCSTLWTTRITKNNAISRSSACNNKNNTLLICSLIPGHTYAIKFINFNSNLTQIVKFPSQPPTAIFIKTNKKYFETNVDLITNRRTGFYGILLYIIHIFNGVQNCEREKWSILIWHLISVFCIICICSFYCSRQPLEALVCLNIQLLSFSCLNTLSLMAY